MYRVYSSEIFKTKFNVFEWETHKEEPFIDLGKSFIYVDFSEA